MAPTRPLGELEGHLAARGLVVAGRSKGLEVLLPATPRGRDVFYAHLLHYAFRLVLRDILKHPHGFTLDHLTRFADADTVQAYLRFLQRVRLIRSSGQGQYRLVPGPVRSLGETLEWFAAEILRREFHAEAHWGLRFKNTPHGGDYDAVACLAGRLVYVEIKAGPPRNLDPKDAAGFLGRLEDLSPELAFFWVDTELRLKDKVVPLLEGALRERHGDRAAREAPLVRLQGELFHVNHQVYLLNSKRDVVNNFRLCFRDSFRARLRI